MEPNNLEYRLGPALENLKVFLRSQANRYGIDPKEFKLYLHGSGANSGRTRERKAAGKSKKKPKDVDVLMVVPDFLDNDKVTLTETEWGDELAKQGIDLSFAHPDEIERVGGEYLLKLDENVLTPLNLFN